MSAENGDAALQKTVFTSFEIDETSAFEAIAVAKKVAEEMGIEFIAEDKPFHATIHYMGKLTDFQINWVRETYIVHLLSNPCEKVEISCFKDNVVPLNNDKIGLELIVPQETYLLVASLHKVIGGGGRGIRAPDFAQWLPHFTLGKISSDAHLTEERRRAFREEVSYRLAVADVRIQYDLSTIQLWAKTAVPDAQYELLHEFV